MAVLSRMPYSVMECSPFAFPGAMHGEHGPRGRQVGRDALWKCPRGNRAVLRAVACVALAGRGGGAFCMQINTFVHRPSTTRAAPPRLPEGTNIVGGVTPGAVET